METVPFEIAHCSSFEQDYEPEQLLISGPTTNQDPFKSVNHRGWQTKKLPEYPQDLILHFKPGFCRISKVQLLSHHYKIASQIELYIGITKELDDDSLYIEFTRLGFVNFDNNNRFQDRELKSIKIQADCEYIRLVIKGCHENRLNVHKQVGILAINIIGYEVREQLENTSAGPYHSQNIINDEEFTQQERSAASQYNANTDFNLEHWIQVIQNTEEESAQDEDFKQAKLYKELGDRLTGLWRFLINLENEKLQAVATKDYDEAEKIKADMIQVRETAESLLKQSGIQITAEGDILPLDTIISSSLYNSSEEGDEEDEHMVENIIPDIQSIRDVTTTTSKLHQSSVHPDQLLDEAIANWTSFDALSISNNKKEEESSPSLLSARIPISNASQNQQAESIPAKEQQQQIDPETIPEPLTADDIESCEVAIQRLGEDVVACIMSIKVKCRQNGLNQLSQLILEEKNLINIEEKEYLTDLEFAEASLLMVQEAVTDSRESIFNQAIQVWKDLHEILLGTDKKVFRWIEKFFSRILMRTSDSNPGIKTMATKVILDLIDKYQGLTALCLKERMIRNLKDAKARVELVTIVTKKSLLTRWKEDNSLYRKDIMTFIVSYLKKHPHADVRKSTWELLVIVAQHQDFKVISTFLENDTIKSLQQELKKSEKKKAIKSSNSTTVNELRALAVKSNSSVTTSRKKQQAKSNARNPPSGTSNTKKAKVEVEEEEEDKNNVCIFCEEEDDDFNEDTLISHYYNDCPVLTNCPMCQIILEVSTLKEHSKKDCEKKHLAKQCNNCKESIPIEQWKQHTLKNTCIATSKGQSRCPFCQQGMSRSSEADWKVHLVSQCHKNPRKPKN